MQQPPLQPISEEDSEEQVLGRILAALEQSGPMEMEQLIGQLELYRNSAAEKLLWMAIRDGTIRFDESQQKVALGEVGREIAQEMRGSKRTMKHWMRPLKSR